MVLGFMLFSAELVLPKCYLRILDFPMTVHQEYYGSREPMASGDITQNSPFLLLYSATIRWNCF